MSISGPGFYSITLYPKRLFLIGLLALFCSCQQNKTSGDIPLLDDVSFLPVQGEEISATNPTEQRRYADFFNSGRIQIPLFKIIKHQAYTFYVGIPIETGLADLSRSSRHPEGIVLSDTSYYNYYTHNGLTIAEYATFTKSGNMLFVGLIGSSFELNDTLFTEQTLSGRLIKR